MNAYSSLQQSESRVDAPALVAECRQGLDQLGRELGEVALLVKQTTGEIERLTPVWQDASRRLREMEAALDQYSRADIRRIYNQAQEAQLRLFMMQSRLEQLQYKQRTLDRSQQLLALSLRALGERSVDEDDDGPSGDSPATAGATASVTECIQVVEEDRLHIARLLHNQVTQGLAGLILRVQICERLLGNDDDRCRAELADLRESMSNSLQELRRTILEVRPIVIDDIGLVPTLRRYVQALNERGRLPVELVLSGGEQRLVPDAELNIFRIIQEAIENSLRHASASQARVHVDFGERVLRLVIEDDGAGFDVAPTLKAARARKAPGIAAMLDRAAAVNGRLVIESTPGRGTRITVQVPLDEQTLPQ